MTMCVVKASVPNLRLVQRTSEWLSVWVRSVDGGLLRNRRRKRVVIAVLLACALTCVLPWAKRY